MEYLSIDFPATLFAVESRGTGVTVDPREIPKALLVSAALHGIKQKVADAASGAARSAYSEVKGGGEPTREELKAFTDDPRHLAKLQEHTRSAMEKALKGLYAGEWVQRQAGGTSTKQDGATALAHEMAREALVVIFTNVCKRAGQAYSPATAIGLGKEKVAKFFDHKVTPTGRDSYTWNKDAIAAFIAGQAESGRDFMAEATAEIARRAEAAATMAGTADDLDDLLGDI